MPLTSEELSALLDRLLAGWENEVVEFKQATHQFSLDKTGEYVAALSNEANLRGLASGWLVFGVSNTRQVVGTTHLIDMQQRQSLKHQVYQSIDQGLTVREIFEVVHSGKRIVFLEIPAAPRGIPISWKGDYRSSAGESLVPMPLDKLEEIRRQTINTDWTSVTVREATINDLDMRAIARARQGFSERHAARIPAKDIAAWDTATFLARARLTRGGQITRACLLLLGADLSHHLLSPHPAHMTWKLVGEQHAYQHFYPPFLLTATELTKRIRNVQMRLMPPDELIYREISKYDERSLLEAIHNCIAHQDYTLNARIIVTEHPDRVEYISVGEFFDGSPEEYALDQRTPRSYRNPFLVEAMTELNMIDRLGYGIQRMVQDQVRRFLPLPDYNLTTVGEVHLSVPGMVIDQAYSQQLMVHTDLPLEDVLALDRVQKGLAISEQTARRLRKSGLIEGRKPRRRITPVVAAAGQDLPGYIRNRPQPDAHYMALVLDLLQARGHADRSDINELLLPLLPENLSAQQRSDKVGNLLAKLRASGRITNEGTRSQPRWCLSYGQDHCTPLTEEPTKDTSSTHEGDTA